MARPDGRRWLEGVAARVGKALQAGVATDDGVLAGPDRWDGVDGEVAHEVAAALLGGATDKRARAGLNHVRVGSPLRTGRRWGDVVVVVVVVRARGRARRRWPHGGTGFPGVIIAEVGGAVDLIGAAVAVIAEAEAALEGLGA